MILKGSVFSKVLEMETGITVVVPNDFKEGNTYRVAYLLHGLCGSNGDWVNYSMLPVYANNSNIIFIMPEVARSFYADLKYGQKYFSYITEELPMICKSVFNISEKRENTAIIGGSMGGYGALKCALSKPEQYAFCCAFSSPCLFLKDDLKRTEGAVNFRKFYGDQLFKDFQAIFGKNIEYNSDNDILELARRANTQKNKPKIYSVCGTYDYLYNDNIRFRNEMKKFDFDFTYEEWQGNHDWFFFNEALRRAIAFCFKY